MYHIMHANTQKYYLAFKRWEFMSFAKEWMNPEHNRLSEIR